MSSDKLNIDSVLALDRVHWFTPIPRLKAFECALIPSASMATTNLAWDPMDARTVRRVCTDMFVDFKGAVTGDDEKPFKNTIENRVKLYNWMPCRTAINAEVGRLMEESSVGETDAESG